MAYPIPGQFYNVTLEFVGVNTYTGLGIFNVIGSASYIEIRLNE